MLGPSTPVVPAVFAESPRRVSLLLGIVVTNAEGRFRAVARGAGTRDFAPSMAEINVRVLKDGNRLSSSSMSGPQSARCDK